MKQRIILQANNLITVSESQRNDSKVFFRFSITGILKVIKSMLSVIFNTFSIQFRIKWVKKEKITLLIQGRIQAFEMGGEFL